MNRPRATSRASARDAELDRLAAAAARSSSAPSLRGRQTRPPTNPERHRVHVDLETGPTPWPASFGQADEARLRGRVVRPVRRCPKVPEIEADVSRSCGNTSSPRPRAPSSRRRARKGRRAARRGPGMARPCGSRAIAWELLVAQSCGPRRPRCSPAFVDDDVPKACPKVVERPFFTSGVRHPGLGEVAGEPPWSRPGSRPPALLGHVTVEVVDQDPGPLLGEPAPAVARPMPRAEPRDDRRLARRVFPLDSLLGPTNSCRRDHDAGRRTGLPVASSAPVDDWRFVPVLGQGCPPLFDDQISMALRGKRAPLPRIEPLVELFREARNVPIWGRISTRRGRFRRDDLGVSAGLLHDRVPRDGFRRTDQSGVAGPGPTARPGSVAPIGRRASRWVMPGPARRARALSTSS